MSRRRVSSVHLDMFVALVFDPGQVEVQIDRTIEATVADLVEKELEKYIPKELRKQVDKQRMEMQQVQVHIRNSLSIPCAHTQPRLKYSPTSADIFHSEAQRSNSFIKTPKQFGEPLQHLINERGIKCDLFPKTVNDLLTLEGQLNTSPPPTCESLTR